MSSSYRLELDRWLSQLDVKADKVLDIGGSQLPVKDRTKTWDVKEYLIADLPEPHVNSPKPDIELDINLKGVIAYDSNSAWFTANSTEVKAFDLIFCLEVMDYVYDPKTALQNISNMLKISGKAWVTFPAFYPHHQPLEDDALLYKEYGIRKLAKASGLTIKQMIKRRPETTSLEEAWAAERMRAAKGYDHHITGFIVEFQRV